MSVLLDESFKMTLLTLKKSLPHAVLFHGHSGVGLKTIAQDVRPKRYAEILIQPVQKTKTSLPIISVEVIRQLYESVRSHAKQLVIVDDADSMTEAAQNALLKLLEEPNASTTFILTTHAAERLLPTIRSRVQGYYVPLVPDNVLETLLEHQKLALDQRIKMLFIAAGRPAEMKRLLANESYFRQRSSQVSQAKTLLGSDSYQVAATLHKHKLDRGDAVQLIDDMIYLTTRSPSKSSMTKLTKLIEARDAITYGGNNRLQLMRAMV